MAITIAIDGDSVDVFRNATASKSWECNRNVLKRAGIMSLRELDGGREVPCATVSDFKLAFNLTGASGGWIRFAMAGRSKG